MGKVTSSDDSKNLDERPKSSPATFPIRYSDGVDILDLTFLLWRRKWTIVLVGLAFAVIGVAYALLATPKYRSDVVLSLKQADRGPSVPSELGGIASLVGVNLSVPTDRNQAIATLRSRAFAEGFIREHNLLPVLFADEWDEENEQWLSTESVAEPDIRDAVNLFVEDIRSIAEDPDTGLITLEVEWRDPETAARWAGELVRRINSVLQQRALSEAESRLEYLNAQLETASFVELRQAIARLIEEQIQTIMLAQAEDEYAFRIIDPPRVPKERVSPRRTLIVLIAGLLGGIVAVFGVLVHHALIRRYSQT